jgi:hypothetical protein
MWQPDESVKQGPVNKPPLKTLVVTPTPFPDLAFMERLIRIVATAMVGASSMAPMVVTLVQ